MQFSGRKIVSGSASGEALVSSMGISFFGGIDSETGIIAARP